MNQEERRSFENDVKTALTAASKDYEEYFEQQRRDYGRAQRLLGEVSGCSHDVFWYLERDEVIEAEYEFTYCQIALTNLNDENINIPGYRLKEIQNAAGQELFEARLGLIYYPVLRGKKEPADVYIPTDRELGITPQAWLNGLPDFASEVGKLSKGIVVHQIHTGRLLLTKENLYERCLVIQNGIWRFLIDRFGKGRAYPLILSATSNPRQGYSTKKRLVANAAFWTTKDLSDLNGIESEAVAAILDQEAQ